MFAIARLKRLTKLQIAGLAAMGLGLAMLANAAFIPAKAAIAQILLERAWAKTEAGDPIRPWPWADFTPAARLSFPEQNQSVIALTDAAGESLAFGPSHMAASQPPGRRGVAVYAAHRDTHFRFIEMLKPGDPIEISTDTENLTFHVTGSEIVRWNASGVNPEDGGSPRLALVTCWPLDGKFQGPMRYVVWAIRSASPDA
ncbi:MAG: class GN sortase [Pseudomonadota bacterium]